MKLGFYPKLAFSDIKKNSRFYTPYILTCIGMVMMYYIMAFLQSSNAVAAMRGAKSISLVLKLGSITIAIFALIFLFYTNSFIVRRRKKELGLYNILGMNKKNIALLLAWESLICGAVAIISGLILGVIFSKLAELALVNMMRGKATYDLYPDIFAMLRAVIIFGAIFLIILLNTLRQLCFSNPIELLRSENTGEKPPKANWFISILGLLLLGGAYALAVSIKKPIDAMGLFFVAVIMVIVGTYMLFISGSVTLCRALRKNRKYYYNPKHFVSVSSMAYRMKRNGAGLASICILATMVLVMISSTTCLYVGSEDCLRAIYPRNIVAGIRFSNPSFISSEKISNLKGEFENIISESEHHDVISYSEVSCYAYIHDGIIDIDNDNEHDAALNSCGLLIVPLSDYNNLTGENESLKNDEVMVYCDNTSYNGDSLMLSGIGKYSIKKQLENTIITDTGINDIAQSPELHIVVNSIDEFLDACRQYAKDDEALLQNMSFSWYYRFDSNESDEKQVALSERINGYLSEKNRNNQDSIESYFCSSVAKEKSEFFEIYGGLFFLGIMLSIMFIAAAVLIIYYKQIAEGYEDYMRFTIMQNVGMTKRDIKRSINSQLLTVFFLPLIAAGIHLAFAFPMLQKVLLVFNLTNVKLFIMTTIISFAVFALLYTLVYKITSNAYYNIVSGASEKEIR